MLILLQPEATSSDESGVLPSSTSGTTRDPTVPVQNARQAKNKAKKTVTTVTRRVTRSLAKASQRMTRSMTKSSRPRTVIDLTK